MKFIRAFILSMLLLFFYAGSLLAGEMKAGVAVVRLTPPLEMGYTLGGYGARMSKPAEGIHDDIKAKALVLDNGKIRYAIVTIDILGLPPNVKPQVIQKLHKTGWNEKNILLLPSHAHSSLEMFALNDKNVFNIKPIGIFQPVLLNFVVEKLVSVIKKASSNLQPVLTGTDSQHISGRNRNRRGCRYVDSMLTVTRIDKTDGTPLAVLVNWTAHPTIMDEHDMWVSAGWPGYLQREMEACIGSGVIAMYYNGAEGDQSVITKGGGSHYEKAEIYGREMAIEALKLYRKITLVRNEQLSYNYRIIKLPDRQPHPGFMATAGKEYGLSEENIQQLLNQVQPVKTSIGACRLGNLLIAGAPGELTAELGLKIKEELKKYGIKYPVIGGLANQWVSYILSEKEYEKGGYEAAASFYGKTPGKTITQGLLDTAFPLTK